jgi:hypothetical protein
MDGRTAYRKVGTEWVGQAIPLQLLDMPPEVVARGTLLEISMLFEIQDGKSMEGLANALAN